MSRRRAYKQVRFEQLRSFCETARLGSLTAAAASMGLAHQTVWEQVHALESALKAALIEPHKRGCRLTDEGRMLVELAAPKVMGLETLLRDFQEKRGKAPTRLAVAATPRVLVEDVSGAILEFTRTHPLVQLLLVEVSDELVPALVKSGKADLGLTTESHTAEDSPWLAFEPAYELELFLVTPADHPLARRRSFRPQDLLDYPLVGSSHSASNRAVAATLRRLGLKATSLRAVETSSATCIRRYVEMGLGISVMPGLMSTPRHPNLHERSISEQFGRISINFVFRKDASGDGGRNDLIETVKTLLKRPAGAKRTIRKVPATSHSRLASDPAGSS